MGRAFMMTSHMGELTLSPFYFSSHAFVAGFGHRYLSGIITWK
jgi:hypothetical protein